MDKELIGMLTAMAAARAERIEAMARAIVTGLYSNGFPQGSAAQIAADATAIIDELDERDRVYAQPRALQTSPRFRFYAVGKGGTTAGKPGMEAEYAEQTAKAYETAGATDYTGEPTGESGAALYDRLTRSGQAAADSARAAAAIPADYHIGPG